MDRTTDRAAFLASVVGVTLVLAVVAVRLGPRLPPDQAPVAVAPATAPPAPRARPAPTRRAPEQPWRVAEAELPTTLDPLRGVTDADRRAAALVFDRLFQRDTRTARLESVIVSEATPADATTLRLALRDDVRWHDGRPLAPEDVCFTLDRLADPAAPGPLAAAVRRRVSGCAVDGPHAVRVSFAEPGFDPRLALAVPVVPAHAYGQGFATHPIGTGPMRAERDGEQVHFVPAVSPHHPVRTPGIDLVAIPDPVARVRAALEDRVDVVVSVPPALRAEVAASDDLALRTYLRSAVWSVDLRVGHPTLADPRVRAALDAALDRRALAAFASDPTDPLPPLERVSGPFGASSPYNNRAVKLPEADPAVVAARMQEAGAVRVGGEWQLAGAPVALRVGMPAALETEAPGLLDAVVAQLRAAGFAARGFRLPEGEAPGDPCDLVIGTWTPAVSEAEVDDLFHTPTAERGLANASRFSDPDVDTLLDRFRAAPRDIEAQDAFHDLHARLAELRPRLFLWTLAGKSAWRIDGPEGAVVAPDDFFGDLEDWEPRTP